MAASASDSVGLLFRIAAVNETKKGLSESQKDAETTAKATADAFKKADSEIADSSSKTTKKVKSDIEQLRADIKKEIDAIKNTTGDTFAGLAKSMGLTAEETAHLSASLPVIGTVLAGVTTAGVGVAAALFSMAKGASDYGSKIFDASQKTGLHAETLSAMDYALKQSDGSLEKITNSLAFFSKGVSKGTIDLKTFGITPQQALNDIDGALGKVFAKIAAAPAGLQQMNLAQQALGRSGANLIPFIQQFSGDLPGLIAKAKELGVTLTDADAAAADDFGDTLAKLEVQFSSIERQFAFGFVPGLTRGMESVSVSLQQNKDEWRQWGDWVGDKIALATRNLQFYYALLQSFSEYTMYGGGHTALDKQLKNDAEAQDILETRRIIAENKKHVSPDLIPTDAQMAAAAGITDDQQSKNAKKLAKDNFNAVQSINSENLKENERMFQASQEGWKKHYTSLELTTDQYRKAFLLNEKEFVRSQKNINDSKFNNDIAVEPNAEKRKALTLQRDNNDKDIERESQKRIEANATFIIEQEKRVTEAKKRAADERFQIAETEVGRALEYYKADDDRKIAQLELDKANKANGIVNEETYQTKLAEIRRQALEDELIKLQGYTTTELEDRIAKGEQITQGLIHNTDISAQKRAELNQRIKILNVELKTDELKTSKDITDARISDIDKEIAKNKELQRSRYAEGTRPRTVPGQPVKDITPETKTGGILGSIVDIFGGLAGGGVSEKDSTGKIKSQADYLKDVYSDIEQSSKQAIGSMIGGLADLAIQWAQTGKFSVKAAGQMVAGILAALAIEDGIKALHQVAEGIAAASNPITAWMAPGHFLAAAHYAEVAALAGAGAVAAGIASNTGADKSVSSTNAATSSGVASSGSSSRSDEERVITEGRGQRSEPPVVIHLSLRMQDGVEVDHIIKDIDNLGRSRNAIIKVMRDQGVL